jgi:hypothetical protein
MEPSRPDLPSGGEPRPPLPVWAVVVAALLLLLPPLNQLWPLLLLGVLIGVIADKVSVRHALPLLLVAVLAGLSASAWNAGWRFARSLHLPEVSGFRLPAIPRPGSLKGAVINERLDFSGVSSLRVVTFNGAVTVREGSEHRLSGSSHAGTSVTVDRRGDGLVVEARRTFLQFGGGATLELTVPEGLDLAVNTANGLAQVEVPVSRLTVNNANGPIVVRDPGQADLELSTSNAAVNVSGAEGSLTVRNGNGVVQAQKSELSSLDIETSNGSVVLDGLSLGDGDRHRVESSNGAITVTNLESEGLLEVRAGTSNARVEAELPGFTVSTSDHSFEAVRPGEEGARLELRTSNAPVVVRAGR